MTPASASRAAGAAPRRLQRLLRGDRIGAVDPAVVGPSPDGGRSHTRPSSQRWTRLEKIETVLELGNFPELDVHDAEQLWEALHSSAAEGGDTEPADLRREEYSAFTGVKGPADYRSEFKVAPEPVPDEAGAILGKRRQSGAVCGRSVLSVDSPGSTRCPTSETWVEVDAVDTAWLALLGRTSRTGFPASSSAAKECS